MSYTYPQKSRLNSFVRSSYICSNHYRIISMCSSKLYIGRELCKCHSGESARCKKGRCPRLFRSQASTRSTCHLQCKPNSLGWNLSKSGIRLWLEKSQANRTNSRQKKDRCRNFRGFLRTSGTSTGGSRGRGHTPCKRLHRCTPGSFQWFRNSSGRCLWFFCGLPNSWGRSHFHGKLGSSRPVPSSSDTDFWWGRSPSCTPHTPNSSCTPRSWRAASRTCGKHSELKHSHRRTHCKLHFRCNQRSARWKSRTESIGQWWASILGRKPGRSRKSSKPSSSAGLRRRNCSFGQRLKSCFGTDCRQECRWQRTLCRKCSWEFPGCRTYTRLSRCRNSKPTRKLRTLPLKRWKSTLGNSELHASRGCRTHRRSKWSAGIRSHIGSLPDFRRTVSSPRFHSQCIVSST